MDSRREQVAILITSLTDHIKTRANEASSRVCIPEKLQKEVEDLLPQFDSKRYESTSLPEFIKEIVTTKLVAALNSLDTWGKLDGKAFVTVTRILLATESCLSKEQGLFQLMCVLEENVVLVNTSEKHKEGHQRLAEFKATVGERLLFPLYFAFIDNSKPSITRRWIGLLFCHLIRDSAGNIELLKGFPSQLFKNLGKIIIESNDRLLKGVSGKLIGETLTGLQLNDWSKHLKYFWPLGMASYYAEFPGEFEEEDWEPRLFEYIDATEKRHQVCTGFNATNITIGDCEIESESTLVSLTDFISAYIPRKGAQRPIWIDVKACNVEIVDIYSPYIQDDEQAEDEKLAELQLTLVDYNVDRYLFLRSSQPSTAPERIAFTVKDIHGDHYADIIEKARNLARFVTRRPALGEPLSDLELPTGSHRSHNYAQAALETRREAITSMADSPTVERINSNQKAGGKKDSYVHQVEGNGISHSTRPPTELQTGALAPLTSVQAVSGALARPESTVTTSTSNSKSPGSDGASVKSAVKEAGLSQHLKALKKETTIEKRETLLNFTTASTATGNLAHPPINQKKNIYESDSELSELSEPPEELEPVISLPILNVDNPKNVGLAVPRFKKADKLIEQGANGSIHVVRSGAEISKISDKKKALLGTHEKCGRAKLQVKGIKDASSGVGDQVLPRQAPIFQKSQVPNATLNEITTTAMRVAEDKIQQKACGTSKGLIDSGVEIPTSLEKPSTSTRTLLKKTTAKPTTQLLKKTVAVARNPLNFTKQIKVPIKVHPNNGKILDIYELPSDDEEHCILPVKGKGGRIKQNTVPVKGKGKTMTRKPTSKSVTKPAPEAEENDIKKLGVQHRNNVPSKIPEVSVAVNEGSLVPTAIKLGINEIRAEHLVYKIQEDRAHKPSVQCPKVKAPSKTSIQEIDNAPEDIRVAKRVVPDATRIPAKQGNSRLETHYQGEVEISAFEVQISNTPGDVVSAQRNVPKDPVSTGMAYEVENAKPAEASGGTKVSKGKLVILPENIQEHTEGETKEEEVESDADNALPFKSSVAIDGHTLKHTPSGGEKLTTSGILNGSKKAQTTLKRKAKVSEVGPSCKRFQGRLLMGAEPVQLPGRTRRAAANVALAKLKLQSTSSIQYQDEEERTGAVNTPQENVLAARCRHVESPGEKNRASPSPQKKLLDVQEPNDNGLPDLEHHPHLIKLVVEQHHDQTLVSDIPIEPCIVKPMALAEATEELEPSAMVSGISGPKEAEVIASVKATCISTVKGGSDNHFQHNSHAADKPVITRDTAPSDATVQVALPIAHVRLPQKKQAREPQVPDKDKGSKTIRIKLQAPLNPKTPDVPLDNLLNRKPQIISWGKKGPLNQGRLVDTSEACGHRGLSISLTKAQSARHEEEDSPSQRVRTKRQKIGTTQSETQPGNTEDRSHPFDSLLFSKDKAVLHEPNPKGISRCSPLVSGINTHDMLQGEDQGVQSHVPVSFSDLPEEGIERLRDESEEMDHESLLAQMLDNEQLNSVVQVLDAKGEESVPQPSPHDFIPSESFSIRENRVTLPKTPEGKRTDFWNEPGYTRNIDIGSEGTPDVGGPVSISLKPQKPRMKQMVLSEDVPPVLIKQSGKRIESTTVDDPFKGNLSATRPPRSSFLERLNNICNGSTSQELKTSPEDLPEPQTPPLQFLKNKPLNALFKHAKSRVAENMISSLDPKVVKAVVRKESLRKQTPLTRKAMGKTTYEALTLPAKYGLDTEMTLVNSSSPLCYNSGTEISSSSSYVESNVDLSVDEESSNNLGGSVKEACLEDTSYDSSILGPLNVFPEIGKLFEEDLRAQEAVATSLLESLKSSALKKVGLLKRAREVEFDDYTKKLDGPVTKKGKHACWAAQTCLEAVVGLVSHQEVKAKGNRVGHKENGYCKAEKIEALCKERWVRVDSSLKTLKHFC
ncbi:hypothetical protein BGX38DRAFT_1269908 [Terfezia claveryi]|nr:hypothetical protein BGX38DRAFT_1269908 [Terfezia claveryi]